MTASAKTASAKTASAMTASAIPQILCVSQKVRTLTIEIYHSLPVPPPLLCKAVSGTIHEQYACWNIYDVGSRVLQCLAATQLPTSYYTESSLEWGWGGFSPPSPRITLATPRPYNLVTLRPFTFCTVAFDSRGITKKCKLSTNNSKKYIIRPSITRHFFSVTALLSWLY